tara:strand:+ start:129 stop:404 length:276 start_codon:yes stop_codon:yes gene_type:complete
MKKFEVSDALENLLGSIAVLETMREVPETYDRDKFIELALRSAKLHDTLVGMINKGKTWVDEEEEKYLEAFGDDLVNILEEWSKEESEKNL